VVIVTFVAVLLGDTLNSAEMVKDYVDKSHSYTLAALFAWLRPKCCYDYVW